MKNKVLLLMPDGSSFSEPLQQGFSKLGWETKVIYYRKGIMPIRILRFIPLIGGLEKAKIYIEIYIKIISLLYKPKLLVVNKGETLSQNLINFFKLRNCITVNLFPEYLNFWDLARSISGYYDIFWVFDKSLMKSLKKTGGKNLFYLPFAANTEPLRKCKKIYDLSFIGTYKPWREKMLKSLIGYRLNIWGDPKWYQSSLRNYTKGGRIPHKKMIEIIHKTKINLNFYFDGIKMDGVNLRVFEVTGCGEFLLTEYTQGLKSLFKNKKEVVWFTSPKQLIKNVDKYLSNNRLRNDISVNGYKRAGKDHNWKKRVRELLLAAEYFK